MAASIHCSRGWDNNVCSLPSHDPLLLSVMRVGSFRDSGWKKDYIPDILINPMKQSLPNFIKIKLVTMQTFAITRGIAVLLIFLAYLGLLNKLKKIPPRMFLLCTAMTQMV